VADDALISSLSAAVDAQPDDDVLRLHLAALLAAAGRADEAVRHAATVLQHDPGNVAALEIIGAGGSARPETPPAPERAAGFDWAAAESDVGELTPPMFVSHEAGEDQGRWDADVERPGLRLADVGGMEEVKKRLQAAFLAPLRNPELRRAYAMSLRGGLLLYGPPGCGKTFIARALAGELGAAFFHVSLSDVLDMYIGQSERNIHEVFELARRSHPCVLFLDEVDAIGQRRSQLRHSGVRSMVNQLLLELDNVEDSNEGVFVLAATNAPWDVDVALRRPGRLDRTLLVLPPDAPAREQILRLHLRDRPIGGIDLPRLVAATDGYSGADLAHVCEAAAEHALLDSAESGQVRLITMADMLGALDEVRASTTAWFEPARNVALFANEGGAYDDLLAYLRQRKMV
jgi:SpoVK/Ycf46/Vps4 family AAA+-type ATPase